MLIHAFASDLAGQVKIEALRRHVENLLWRKIEGAS
jgi:hypothetical protein